MTQRPSIMHSLPMNRSAEHRLGKFLNAAQRAGAVLGAPIVVAALAIGLATNAHSAKLPYAIVATGQAKCYDNHGEIAPPKPGQPFYGQDAQFQAHPASYTLGADGLTVRDNVTSLTWQRSPDTDGDGSLTRHDKLTLSQAQAPHPLN